MNILLVEDEAGIGRFITRGLRTRGFNVHWERVGKNVLQLARSGRFNTVILDLVLPDSHGFELCREIRSAEQGVPILLLTAHSQIDDRIDGFAAGADDYLGKPFEFRELAARVSALARRDKQRRPDPATWGALRVDPSANSATWDGQEFEAAPRALLLLAALARARGEVVEREALIEAVWGSEATVSDNALDVRVSALRRELAAVTDLATVQSFKGRGFALRVAGANC